MLVYVAARLAEIELVQAVQNQVRDAGHAIAYDWASRGTQRGDPDAMRDAAVEMVAGVRMASRGIVLLANGDQSPQRGSHVELGILLAKPGVKVLVWAPPEFSYVLEPAHPRCISFYLHFRVEPLVCSRAQLPSMARAWLGPKLE